MQSTVDVLNGDGAPGLATTVSQALVGAGLTAGATGNSTQPSTSVSYGSGAHADADATLLAAPPASADPSLPAGHLSVVLGRGFTPFPTLTQRAARLKTTAPPTAAAPTGTGTGTGSASVPPAGPQGLPVDGGGIPCVD